MSETKIIDKIKVNDIEASILGAKYDETNSGIAFQSSSTSAAEAFATNNGSAVGDYSHAEGYETIASGQAAHAEGIGSSTAKEVLYGYRILSFGTPWRVEEDYFTNIRLDSLEGLEERMPVRFDTNREDIMQDSNEDMYIDYLRSETSEIEILINANLAQSISESGALPTRAFLYTPVTPSLGTTIRLYEGANGAHAEGGQTQANGDYSHAEGMLTIASGESSHAEGKYTRASGIASHAEGGGSEENFLIASGDYSHAEGYNTRAEGQYSHAEGNCATAIGQSAHAEGEGTEASGWASHAEGFETHAFGGTSHAEGQDTIASGPRSHAEGDASEAIGETSHTEGKCTRAFGKYSHAEGDNTISGGNSSHTEGYQTKTATEFGYEFFEVKNIIRPDGEDYQGDYYLDLQLDSIEGLESDFEVTFDTDDQDINMCCSRISKINHVDKIITLRAIGQDGYILAEADFSTLKRKYFYIYDEPELGTAARNGASYAHAEGNSTQALGEASHAEGKDTQATGNYSHAGGIGTIASTEAQTVIGKYNQEDSGALFIIGNGNTTKPSNAFIVKNDGTVIAKGKELTADTVVDNTIQDFKVSDDFITTTDEVQTITRNEKTTFVYNYTNDNQYLNPPLRNYLDATSVSNKNKMTNGNIASKEYITVERWMGLPVYQAVIKLKGSIEYIDIPWNAMENTNYTVFDATGLLIYDGTNTQSRNMPYGYAHIWGENNFQTGCLRIRKSSTSSLGDNYTILFTIKYVKATSADILDLT